ncbi:UNVERIFIED_CONTAM: hypothetical protein GTU68_018530, partial [Idotea baltica]|nr:hypothetical protein [Idotea baltica]
AGRSNALTSTLDILPTISSLVNADTSNLTLDGYDISEVLLKNSNLGPRDFFAVYPESPTQEMGPFAIIYKRYKAHFYTKGSDLSDVDNYDPLCPSKHNLTLHDPPLLFDLYSDPGERYDLGKMEEHRELLAAMSAWREDHMRNMT